MHHVRSALVVAACLGMAAGCSTKNDLPGGGTEAGTGGTSGSGGGTASAGNGATGGTQTNTTGGTSGTGGSAGAAIRGGAGGAPGASGSGGVPAASGAGGAGARGGGGAVGGAPAAGAGGSTLMGGAGAGAGAGGAAGVGGTTTLVEDQSADCVVGEVPDSSTLTKQITKLPDPFTKLDGTRVASTADWHCRRAEIRAQAEKYVFGAKPKPDLVSGTVSDKSVSVHVEAKGKAIDFSVSVVLPSTGHAPYPVLINVGTSGSLTLGESRITDQGVAVIYYNNYDLGKEGTAMASRGKPNAGKYYDIYGGTDQAGLLMAWAWGASRLLDVLQQSGTSLFDLTGVGVTGCSRFGKGAFVIGVFDDRIALTIPQEPSTGGDPALRIMDKLSGAERTDYNYNGLNWLSDNFAPFVYANDTSNVVKLPIDTHALIGVIAPRGLLVLENPHQTQMGAPAGYMATVAGSEIYKALGVEQNVSYHSDVADTAHCSYKTEYTDMLVQSLSAFLKHSGAPPGKIVVGADGSLDESDWVDWDAPTLN
ncbi:MAG TPA: hypothetical protein VMI54_10595 [Polyangiaceae bacterium]|nr:hypothetical protein [Polyangiaceae bacterium]